MLKQLTVAQRQTKCKNDQQHQIIQEYSQYTGRTEQYTANQY